MRQRLSEMICREIEHQRRGRRGHLIFKMNALEDPGMMRLLCEASRAGVRVDLLVRGICCLRPGVPGVSDNIRVISIVGRFLEHSRIFYFRNGGNEEVYLGSADLMPRNLNRRVEVLFPVNSPRLVRRVRTEILDRYLSDDANARYMRSDGNYTPKPAAGSFDSQAWFLAQRNTRSGLMDHAAEFDPAAGAAESPKPPLSPRVQVVSRNGLAIASKTAPASAPREEAPAPTSRNEQPPSVADALRESAARLATEIDRLRQRLDRAHRASDVDALPET